MESSVTKDVACLSCARLATQVETQRSIIADFEELEERMEAEILRLRNHERMLRRLAKHGNIRILVDQALEKVP